MKCRAVISQNKGKLSQHKSFWTCFYTDTVKTKETRNNQQNNKVHIHNFILLFQGDNWGHSTSNTLEDTTFHAWGSRSGTVALVYGFDKNIHPLTRQATNNKLLHDILFHRSWRHRRLRNIPSFQVIDIGSEAILEA